MNGAEQHPVSSAPIDGIRVVVADDARELRELIVKLLRRDPRITVVAEGSDTPTTLTAVLEHRPDVLLVDLSMPGGGGLLVISELMQRYPEVRIVVLSGLPREQAEDAALAAGACAYVEKGTSINLVVDAVLNAGGLT